jgi:hypothetical protein
MEYLCYHRLPFTFALSVMDGSEGEGPCLPGLVWSKPHPQLVDGIPQGTGQALAGPTPRVVSLPSAHLEFASGGDSVSIKRLRSCRRAPQGLFCEAQIARKMLRAGSAGRKRLVHILDVRAFPRSRKVSGMGQRTNFGSNPGARLVSIPLVNLA